MAAESKREVNVQRSGDRTTISLPRQFTPDGVIHAVVLTIGIVLVGAVVPSRLNLASLIPKSLSAHPDTFIWSVLLCAYALFLLLCLMGVGSQSLWRMGELGRRGSYVGLMLYSVHAVVSPSVTTITEQWFLRRKTRRFATRQISSIAQSESGLTITAETGTKTLMWFSLYPPTVKRLKRELEAAIAASKNVRA